MNPVLNYVRRSESLYVIRLCQTAIHDVRNLYGMLWKVSHFP